VRWRFDAKTQGRGGAKKIVPTHCQRPHGDHVQVPLRDTFREWQKVRGLKSTATFTSLLRDVPAILLALLVLWAERAIAIQPGSLDTNFNAAIASGGVVYAVALQTNGQILIAGNFTSIGGVGVTNVARLNANGTLDSSFNPGDTANSGYVNALAVQSDGKVVIGGYFASSSGSKPAFLNRLNFDGSADTNFYQYLVLDNTVNAIVIENDGKILFAGAFTFASGYTRRSIARLYDDGELDISFDACVASSAGSGGTGLAVLADGRILATGRYTFSTGYYRDGVARLGSCGELDPSYAPIPGVDAGSTVFGLAVRSGGGSLLAGNFSSFYNVSSPGVVQLTTNGVPDGGFHAGTGINAGGTNFTLALQPDSKVIMGGTFTQYNGQPAYGICRLNLNGSLDPLFNPGSGPNNAISSIALQPDGKILVAGKFTSFNGVARTGLARLNGGPLPFRLSLPKRLNDSQVQLTLFGEAQAHYAIQAASDLLGWTTFTNFVSASNTIVVVDSQAGSQTKCFYRAVYSP
jgi:uncharacterized delta-60 repeat protein